jgi:hypothetical protein
MNDMSRGRWVLQLVVLLLVTVVVMMVYPTFAAAGNPSNSGALLMDHTALQQQQQLEIWTPRCDVIRRSYKYSAECNHTRLPDQNTNRPAPPPAPCLITGTGRSGTQYMSQMLRNLGWEVNHDNWYQFCPCPGTAGSVSHYFSFLSTQACKNDNGWSAMLQHMFLRVGLQLHDPLAYVNSRGGEKKKNLIGFQSCNMRHPKQHSSNQAIMALHKWVLQNTFVGAYSDFSYVIDAVDASPARGIGEVCLRCALEKTKRNVYDTSDPHWYDQQRHHNLSTTQRVSSIQAHAENQKLTIRTTVGCPSNEEITMISNRLSTSANHNHTRHLAHNWTDLAELDLDMTTMAIMVANVHGMNIPLVEPVDKFTVRCGFDATEPGDSPPWSCYLDRGDGIKPPDGLPLAI